MLIVEASHLLGARLRADIDMPGLDEHFVEGHELDEAAAQLIPKNSVGRMMTAADAAKLIERLDRAVPIPKRPPAPSVRRTRARRTRQVGR